MPESLHRLVVRDARQGQGDLQSQHLVRQSRDQSVDDGDDVLHLHKRHFQVQLRELGLTIGTQVFVAKAAGDLHVAVVPGDHHDLLVELRGLGQRVERTGVHAAGYEVIAGTFGRAASQDGRLDVDEGVFFEVVAHRLDDAAAQHERALHGGPPQIQVAVAQPQIFGRQVGLCRHKRRRLAFVQQLQLLAAQLDLAGVQLGIDRTGRACRDFAGHLDHVLAAQRPGLGQLRIAAVGAEDHLGLAIAVAQVNENGSSVIAIAVDPAAKCGLLSDMRQPHLTARV